MALNILLLLLFKRARETRAPLTAITTASTIRFSNMKDENTLLLTGENQAMEIETRRRRQVNTLTILCLSPFIISESVVLTINPDD